jgi:hypothetical protein
MRRRFTGALGARLSALTAALLLGGCAAVGPDFKRPEVSWLAGWSSGSLDCGGQTAQPKAQTGRQRFNDPVLERLVAEAQRQSRRVRPGCAYWRRGQLIAGSGLCSRCR